MILFYNLVLLSFAQAFHYLAEFRGPLTQSNPGSPKSKSAAKINYFPYHALVFYSNWFCSGTIIGSKIILTTASCLLEPDAMIAVKVGVDSIIDDGQTIPVVEAKKHEFYQHLSQLDNDIALLILEPQHRVKKLIWTPLVLQNKVECDNAYGVFMSPSMFCGRYEQLHRLSDNGGAAVFDNRFLVGIASYSGSDNPAVAIFTNVSYFHKWIKINTIRLLQKHCKLVQDTASYYGDYVYDDS